MYRPNSAREAGDSVCQNVDEDEEEEQEAASEAYDGAMQCAGVLCKVGKTLRARRAKKNWIVSDVSLATSLNVPTPQEEYSVKELYRVVGYTR